MKYHKKYGVPLARPFEALVNKMQNGFSPLVCIVGDETGIGKSRLGLKTAELVYYRAFGKIWKPEGNLFFKMQDFKAKLNSSESRIFIIEEAEIELGSDNWHSIQNRYFSRIKSTQRVKGNLYIVILPMISLLAPKHRRAINYIFDVKWKGFFKCTIVKKRSANLDGDDIYAFHLGDCFYSLPNCDEDFDKLDKENKQRILMEEGEQLDIKIAQKNEVRDIYYYTYTCEHCGFVWKNRSVPTDQKNKKCPKCLLLNLWTVNDGVKIIKREMRG